MGCKKTRILHLLMVLLQKKKNDKHSKNVPIFFCWAKWNQKNFLFQIFENFCVFFPFRTQNFRKKIFFFVYVHDDFVVELVFFVVAKFLKSKKKCWLMSRKFCILFISHPKKMINFIEKIFRIFFCF